ncbi:MAG TPA: EAL domain-containing protein [Rhodocyclaceae bacterium]|jgi:EAL and modified HD-GYP domain-containing signal transduction protein
MDISPIPFFLGRQPILDRHGNTVAYELLFRSGETNAAVVDCHEQATVHVLARAFSEFGVANTLGDALGFINFDATLLASDIVDMLPVGRVVLELLEHVEITPSVVENCRRLHGKGFRFALDDITVLKPEHHEILPFISYVKVDVLGMEEAAIEALTQQLKSFKLKLLAEKVETRQQADFCAKVGFDLFQGYYFAHPQVLLGKSFQHANVHLMHLLKLLFSDSEIPELEDVFKQDPKLTYNLVRVVNSVAMGLRSPISSVGQAIIMLGRRQLQSWLTLLAFAHKAEGKFPSPLVVLAACRGKSMEFLAREGGQSRDIQDQAYMAGMMSLMEVLLDIPLAKVAEELNLSDEIRAAILEREGYLGRLLALNEAVERYDVKAIDGLLVELSMTLEQLTVVEVEAMQWAENIGKEI